MVDIKALGNSERINNINAYLQGSNPLALSEDITKSVLALEDVCRESISENKQNELR